MVDIVFQLLVFFVLASGGRVAEQTLATSLSAGSVSSPEHHAAARPARTVWIHLERDAARARTIWRMNGAAHLELASLRQALGDWAGAAAENSVILEVAGNVPLEDLIGAYDTCRAAGIAAINFAASPDEARTRITSDDAALKRPHRE